MTQQNLAVIGAGPKAAALAAKAYCLQQEGFAVSVNVFEQAEIGAHWTGRNGYTDGDQRLCTPAERDLGFPYLPTFGTAVVELMQSRFSWNAFLLSQAGASARYASWVNRGRPPPDHQEFARYLEFAFRQANAVPSLGKVIEILDNGGRWTLRQADKESGDTVEFRGFDGVVFTGPGPTAKRLRKVRDPRIFSGVDFWRRLRSVRDLLPTLRENPIVVIGGGGTAAAVTAWFIRHGVRDHPILLLNNQAMLFTRTSNFFENSLFDDEDTWLALGPADRTDFTRRLNRGVVWESVTDLLSDAKNLSLVPGSADAIRHLGMPGTGGTVRDLEVVYTNERGTHPLPAGMVVVATGFDPWWFRTLLPKQVRAKLRRNQHTALAGGMRPDLSLPLDNSPRLHAPNLADALGPGFGSLMVLGSMADRVLQPYRDAA